MGDEWSTNANEALELAFLDGSKRPTKFFNPSFTYPIFGDNETIFGYSNLNIRLFFKADDLSSVLDVKYDRIVPAGVGEEDDQATDVTETLKEFLPEDVSTDLASWRKSTKFEPNFTPPGTLISTFTNSRNQTFEVYRSPLKEAATKKLLSRIQIMALLFIEGGSTIDVDDEEWTTDRWEVYLLYEKMPDNANDDDDRGSPLKHRFAGYCTVYNYLWFSLLKEKDEGESFRSRISQFIVMPPYKGTGCGREMYNVVIDSLLKMDNVREITVEDPSEVFEELRDHGDLRRLRLNGTFAEDGGFTLEKMCNGSNTQSDESRKWIETNRQKNKLPKRQFLRLVEMQLYSIITENGKNKPIKEDSAEYKKYKMFVKRRLYKHNKDILSQLEKDDRVQKVEETYVGVVADYKKTLDNIEKGAGAAAAAAAAEAADAGGGNSGEGSSRKKRRISAATRDDKDEDSDEEMGGNDTVPAKRAKT